MALKYVKVTLDMSRTEYSEANDMCSLMFNGKQLDSYLREKLRAIFDGIPAEYEAWRKKRNEEEGK